MTKDWLHLPSLERTIDFSMVSDIHWNYQDESDKKIGKFRTLIFLGTSLSASDNLGIAYNSFFISNKEDREKLYAKFPGIDIELKFDREPTEALPENPPVPAGKVEEKDDIPF